MFFKQLLDVMGYIIVFILLNVFNDVIYGFLSISNPINSKLVLKMINKNYNVDVAVIGGGIAGTTLSFYYKNVKI